MIQEKINKKMLDFTYTFLFTYTFNQRDLRDICRTFTGYIFSSPHEILSRIDHVRSQNKFNNFKIKNISKSSDHNGIKVEINNRKKRPGIFSNVRNQKPCI